MVDFTIVTSHKLGDSVNTTSFLVPLKEKHPNSKITWISATKYLPIAFNNPYIDMLITEHNLDREYLESKYSNLIIPEPIKNVNISYVNYWQKILREWVGSEVPMRPLLYQRFAEVKYTEEWLEHHNLKNYVMLEVDCHSNQSFWDDTYTLQALHLIAQKGYSVILTHVDEPRLKEYNKICHTVCMNLSYRYAPILYNRSKGFIGVSSGISCVTHTHQCLTDIPHLEFVRDVYYSNCAYYKKKKTIWWDPHMDAVLDLIDREIK